MGIEIKLENIEKEFDSRKWDSFEEFEEYYLQHFAERGEYIFYKDKNGVDHDIKPVNHHPELKEYEVWEEGYCATGGKSGAQLLGKVKARNFAQACHVIMCQRYLQHVEKENSPEKTGYVRAGRWDYDPSNLSSWGCRLFWSEKLARKSFG